MNNDLTATESRLRLLLDLVAQQQEERCREILQQAKKEAEALLAAAHEESRSRVKKAAKEARRRAQQSLNNAKAHLDTARRQRELRHLATLLHQGREQLHQALLERWQEPAHRLVWMISLARRGGAALSAGALTIRHPVDWSEQEWHQWGEAPPQLTPVTFVADANIQAGLLLCRGGTCVDGTLAGLTSDTGHVEALLLALLAPPSASLSNPRGDSP